jgi:hypothetical protein
VVRLVINCRFGYGSSVDEPEPIGQSVEEAFVKLIRPELLDAYRNEKDRHRKALKAIEDTRKRTRAWIWRCFRSPIREKKYEALETEHAERLRAEEERHANFIADLKEKIRNARDESSGGGSSP